MRTGRPPPTSSRPSKGRRWHRLPPTTSRHHRHASVSGEPWTEAGRSHLAAAARVEVVVLDRHALPGREPQSLGPSVARGPNCWAEFAARLPLPQYRDHGDESDPQRHLWDRCERRSRSLDIQNSGHRARGRQPCLLFRNGFRATRTRGGATPPENNAVRSGVAICVRGMPLQFDQWPREPLTCGDTTRLSESNGVCGLFRLRE